MADQEDGPFTPPADGAAVGDEGVPRLGIGEMVGYSLGDSASNFYWRVFDTFLLIFYTDVFGISAAAAGTLLLVSRFWDAVNDPMMGLIADRTRTRWGRYRPWLIWMIVPLFAAGVLTFTTPDLPEGGKVVYAYVTYILMMMAYTAINIPYSALMGVISPDTEERTTVSTIRFVGAFTGGLVVQSATLWLVKWFGAGDPAVGWPMTMALYGVIAGVMFAITFATTRERVEPTQDSQDLGRDLLSLTRNVPLWIVIVTGTVVLANFVIRGSASMFYLTYYVAVSEMVVFGYTIPDVETLVSIFLTAGGIANLAGVVLTPLLTHAVGKKRGYILCMGIGAVLTLAIFVVPGDQVTTILALNVLTGFLLGPTAPIMFAMYADVADHGEWETGRRTTGLVFSGAMLSTKLGAAIGGFAAGILLDAFGYVPNQAQTPEALLGIVLIVSVFPAVLMLLGVGAMLLYPLTDERMKEIGAELKQRRSPMLAETSSR